MRDWGARTSRQHSTTENKAKRKDKCMQGLQMMHDLDGKKSNLLL